MGGPLQRENLRAPDETPAVRVFIRRHGSCQVRAQQAISECAQRPATSDQLLVSDTYAGTGPYVI